MYCNFKSSVVKGVNPCSIRGAMTVFSLDHERFCYISRLRDDGDVTCRIAPRTASRVRGHTPTKKKEKKEKWYNLENSRVYSTLELRDKYFVKTVSL